MKPTRPNQPTMVYDGQCGFCQYWINKWQRVTQDKIVYIAYPKALDIYPQLSRHQCEIAVQLLLTDGKILSGVQAVLMSLKLVGRYSWLNWAYENISFFRLASDGGYRLIASGRPILSKWFRQSKK